MLNAVCSDLVFIFWVSLVIELKPMDGKENEIGGNEIELQMEFWWYFCKGHGQT